MSLPGPGSLAPPPAPADQRPGRRHTGVVVHQGVHGRAHSTRNSRPCSNAGPAAMYLPHSKLGRGCPACWRRRAQRAHPGCPEVSPGQRQTLACSPDDGIGGKLPQLKPTHHYLVKGMHEKNRVRGLEIAGLRPGNPRLDVRQAGRPEFRLQCLRVAVIIMYGKLHLPAGPWHDHVEEPD